MIQNAAQLLVDDDYVEEPRPQSMSTPTPGEHDRQRSEARRRIEALREEAALKRALTDDILDY